MRACAAHFRRLIGTFHDISSIQLFFSPGLALNGLMLKIISLARIGESPLLHQISSFPSNTYLAGLTGISRFLPSYYTPFPVDNCFLWGAFGYNDCLGFGVALKPRYLVSGA